jgi:hypothetical protein
VNQCPINSADRLKKLAFDPTKGIKKEIQLRFPTVRGVDRAAPSISQNFSPFHEATSFKLIDVYGNPRLIKPNGASKGNLIDSGIGRNKREQVARPLA